MKLSKTIKTSLINSAIFAVISMGAFGNAYAAPNLTQTPTAVTQSHLPSGSFVKKQKSIKGDWTIVTENGQTMLRFSDDFKANNGPDLKVFLSPQTFGNVSGRTATNGALLLGALESNKGSQDYIIPAGVDLSSFKSVLVHCEAYSVLWGGSAL